MFLLSNELVRTCNLNEVLNKKFRDLNSVVKQRNTLESMHKAEIFFCAYEYSKGRFNLASNISKLKKTFNSYNGTKSARRNCS